jgi:PAS domain S-box-containing protein
MHGVRRLDELGRTVDEYRRNFVVSRLDDARPVDDAEHPAERVLAGEAFSDVLVGVVHRERPGVDWVHRVRGLVITDQHGRPDVLALVVHDATDWHEAERRFEQTFGANPAPAVICRLADMRYVKLNDGFLEMTGLRREDVLGRTFDEVDVLEGAERRDLALERLRAGETIPQMEACLRVPVDADKLVVVAGQPIELGAADEPCMLFTFADLEPRRRAETALRQSEERFVTCFRLAPIPLAIGTVEGYRFVDANEAFRDGDGPRGGRRRRPGCRRARPVGRRGGQGAVRGGAHRGRQGQRLRGEAPPEGRGRAGLHGLGRDRRH